MKARSASDQEQAGQKQSPLQDLLALIRSRMPLIVVDSNEEPQVVGLVRQIGRQLQLLDLPVDDHGRNAGVRSLRSAQPKYEPRSSPR